MSIASVVSKLTERILARRQTGKLSFWKLASMLADGKEPSLDQVEKTLEAAGKSVEDLSKAVELVLQRREWQGQLEAIPALRKQREEVRLQIVQAQAELDLAQKKAAAIIDPAVAVLKDLDRDIVREGDCRAKLLGTCPDEELLAQVEANRRARIEVERQAESLVEAISRAEYRAANGQTDEEKARAKAAAADFRAQRHALLKEGNRLQQEAEEIERGMVDA